MALKSVSILFGMILAGVSPPGVAQSKALPVTGSGEVAAAPVSGDQVLSLEELVEVARREGLNLRSARSQVLAAQAGIESARAYPNPELEMTTGSARARASGVAEGSLQTLSLRQRIERDALRTNRIGSARIQAQVAELGVQVIDNNQVAQIKIRYFETLKRQEELDAAREELQLTSQIRERVKVRFDVGEGSRFDLLRAEAEVALAEKDFARIRARLQEARTYLRLAVGAPLPASFQLREIRSRTLTEQDLPEFVARAIGNNPEVQRSTLDIALADQRIALEQGRIFPGVVLSLSRDQAPDLRSTRIGVQVDLPLWDRRFGPVAEARAQAARVRTDSDLLRFEIENAMQAAWLQYQATYKSVEVLETDLIERARQVVRIAEAAYRLGERGIIDYLDARRQFRAVRAEQIQARFELQLAVTELERLAATSLRKY